MAAKDVASMSQYWKEFNLTQLQRELDDTATDLANRQDESDSSRKKLVEQSREFKKNTPEDVRKQVAPLLKSFQAEVDSLSKRSKAAEGAFLSIYKKLIDTPDPTSVLEYCVNLQKRAQKAQDLEIENQKLRETLEEYNKEFAEVKNQEVTIKNLQTRLKEYDERSESVAQARADEKEKELHKDFAEKEKQLQEKQMSVAKKLGEAELKITTLQNALDNTQSELFDIKAKYDEQGAAKSDEMELLMTDLERANQRVAASEKLLEGMQGQLNSATQSLHQAEQMQSAPNVAIDILTRSSLEVELTAKEKEISQLVDDVQRLQASSNKLRDSTASRIQKLEEELATRNTALRKMEERLKGQSDYEEIKRELNVLKSIEFSSSDGGSISEKEDGDATSAPTPKSLEMLLLEKNRALQTENTTLKVTNTDINGGSGVGPGGLAQAQAFASLIGQEVAAAYHQRTAVNSQVPGSQIIQPIIVIPPSLNPHAAAASHMGFVHPMAPSHLHQQPPLPQSPVPSTSHAHTPEPHPQPPKTPPTTIAAVREAAARELAAREAALQQAALRELAMSHQWVDTVQVARRIKDILADNNIGQRLFGEVVLNMSQGSVSDLLSRPKPWDKMTAKGREPFIKMLQFLSSHHHLERLKIINLQKKGKESPPGPTAIASPVKASSDEAINNILALAKQEMEAQRAMAHEHARRMAHEREEYDRHSLRSSPDSTHSFSPKTPLRNESEALDMSMGSDMRHLRDLRRRSLNSLSSESREPSSPNLNGDIARKVEETLENISKTHAMMQDSSALTSGYGPGRAPKRILPPLSCDQYENSKEVDTVDIARQVRELLVKGNIPQRVFGEHIIGMSQGSVSDILSKPKTWDKLTIKGKEPFIRMKIWLDNGARMDKLKELVRRGNYSFTDMSNSFQADTTTPNSNSSSPCPSVEDQPLPLLPASHITKSSHHQRSTSSPHSSNSTPTPKTISPAPLSQPPSSPRPTPSPRAYLQSPSSPNAMPELPPVHEQAAMIEYLDTFAVTQQVKNLLQQHGLGQKAFGEAVLGLTQGSVSDLLSKPKMWLKLSMKGREPYVRMYLWLQDLEGISKVKNYKPKRKARRYVMVNLQPGNSQGVNSPPSKRARVLLTPEEKDCLKASYDKEPYPTQATIDALADQLNLPTSTVINWFHNHRSRLKRGAANVDPENRLVFHTHTESDMSARHALMQEEVSRRAALDERLRQARDNGDVKEDSSQDGMDEERVNDLKQAIVALENASREEEGENQERARYHVRRPEDWMEGQEEEMEDDVEYDEDDEEEEEDVKNINREQSTDKDKNMQVEDRSREDEKTAKRPKLDDTVHRLQNGVKEEKGEWEF